MKQGRNTHAPSFDNNFFVRGIVDDFNNSEVEGKLWTWTTEQLKDDLSLSVRKIVALSESLEVSGEKLTIIEIQWQKIQRIQDERQFRLKLIGMMDVVRLAALRLIRQNKITDVQIVQENAIWKSHTDELYSVRVLNHLANVAISRALKESTKLGR